MKIGKFDFNQNKTFIIAEIGGNHEGDFECAKEMIHRAADAGADAVKFQALKASHIVHPNSKMPAYSGILHSQQWERFKKIEFSKEQYFTLKTIADQQGVIFLASVFDQELVDELDELLPAYKIASGDLTYWSLIRHIRKKKKPVLLSTGAATLQEIKQTVRWIGKKNLILLHCICAYPAPIEQMNLRVIPYLKRIFKIPIGFSDHSVGIDCSLAAVALGAQVIEKHFTLDKSHPKGDHKLSATPLELKQMVESIRRIEKALGKEKRYVYESETRSRILVRRSLYADKNLSKGDRINPNAIKALRPVEGISAAFESKIIGKKIKTSVAKGAVLKDKYF